MRARWTALLLFTVLCGTRTCFGCSCVLSDKCGIPTADTIFLGRVESKQVADGRNADGTFNSVRRATVQFTVLEGFRGVSPSHLEVETTEGCCACGIEFIVSGSYVVFANQYQGTLSTNSCSATQPAASAVALIPQLRARRKGEPTSTLFGLVALQPRPHYQFEPVPIDALRGIEVKAIGTNVEFVSVTDSYGVFDFKDLPNDSYVIEPSLSDPLSSKELLQHMRPISVQNGSSCEYDIWAQWNGRIAGRVIDRAGKPVRGFVTLDYVEPKKMSGAMQTGVGGFTTGDDGRFEFTLLGPDRYRLSFFPGAGSNIDFKKRVTHPEVITLQRGQQITDLVIQVP